MNQPNKEKIAEDLSPPSPPSSLVTSALFLLPLRKKKKKKEKKVRSGNPDSLRKAGPMFFSQGSMDYRHLMGDEVPLRDLLHFIKHAKQR